MKRVSIFNGCTRYLSLAIIALLVVSGTTGIALAQNGVSISSTGRAKVKKDKKLTKPEIDEMLRKVEDVSLDANDRENKPFSTRAQIVTDIGTY